MSWLEDAWNNVTQTAGDWYDTAAAGVGDIIGAKLEGTTERVKSDTAARVKEARAVPVNRSIRKPIQREGFNWQAAGVVVGAAGLALAVYKMVK